MDENNGVEKDSRTQGKTLVFTSGERKWEGARQSKTSEIHTTMYKVTKLQGHTFKHKEYSQQFIIA